MYNVLRFIILTMLLSKCRGEKCNFFLQQHYIVNRSGGDNNEIYHENSSSTIDQILVLVEESHS